MYPTDPVYLASLSVEAWEELLASVWNAPVPRRIVRLIDRVPSEDGPPSISGRRAIILERKAKGENHTQIAKALGVSLGLISKILKGERN